MDQTHFQGFQMQQYADLPGVNPILNFRSGSMRETEQPARTRIKSVYPLHSCKKVACFPYALHRNLIRFLRESVIINAASKLSDREQNSRRIENNYEHSD